MIETTGEGTCGVSSLVELCSLYRRPQVYWKCIAPHPGPSQDWSNGDPGSGEAGYPGEMSFYAGDRSFSELLLPGIIIPDSVMTK